jgi:uncharacterized protein YlzI (FlbEa/FlbD family)
VKDSVDEVVAKVLDYRKKVYSEKRAVNPMEYFEKK